MVTINDIAKLCGLSTTSVSLVLNNKPNRLSEKSRNLIVETARQHGYRRNEIAISLRKGKSSIIGVVVPDISNPFFAMIVKEIENQSYKLGYSITFGNNDDQLIRDQTIFQTFQSLNISGAILFLPSDCRVDQEAQYLETWNNLGVPIVYLDRTVNTTDQSFYFNNHKHGAKIATKHLLSLGHRHIGCLTGPRSLQDTWFRVEGYKSALADARIPLDESLIFEGDYRMQSGEFALKYFIEKHVSAILSLNDMMAYGLYHSAKSIGLRIPEDLSIIGYDDLYFNTLLDTPLTSVKQPWEEIARDATVHLVNRINKIDLVPQRQEYRPLLRVRKSTYPYQTEKIE